MTSADNKAPTPIIKQTRVPIELQKVFLASNRGEVVDKPPARSAFFFRRWIKAPKQPRKRYLFFGKNKTAKFCSQEPPAKVIETNEDGRPRLTPSRSQTFPRMKLRVRSCRWGVGRLQQSNKANQVDSPPMPPRQLSGAKLPAECAVPNVGGQAPKLPTRVGSRRCVVDDSPANPLSPNAGGQALKLPSRELSKLSTLEESMSSSSALLSSSSSISSSSAPPSPEKQPPKRTWSDESEKRGGAIPKLPTRVKSTRRMGSPNPADSSTSDESPDRRKVTIRRKSPVQVAEIPTLLHQVSDLSMDDDLGWTEEDNELFKLAQARSWSEKGLATVPKLPVRQSSRKGHELIPKV